MQLQKFIRAGIALIVLIVLFSDGLLHAQAPEEPAVADSFDFPLGAPDGDGYRVLAGFGIQNCFLKDKASCFLDLEGTYPNPTEPSDYPQDEDHVSLRDLFHAGTDWCSSGDPAETAGDTVTAVANGVVVYVRDPGRWPGAVVVVQHELPDGQIVIPIAFVSASAHRPDVNVRAHHAKPFGLFLAPEGGFAD